jgi:N-methylhydantoinase B
LNAARDELPSGAVPLDLPRQAAVDPVTVEVVRRRLIAIADQVDLNITRTAFSPLVYEYKDYAVGIVDADARLLCQCTGGMPLFVADVLGAAVRDGLEIYGRDGFHEGDVIITNHGGTIGQHLNNVVMYTPVFSPEGELAAFMLVVMHWLDIGGRNIGSISKYATDIFQEGIQFRTVKLRSRGEPVQEMYRMIRHNSRFPDEVAGDIESQVGGCLMGRDEVAQLIARYGMQTFQSAVHTIWDQSEAVARAVISAIPDGVYEASAFMDDDGINVGKPVPLSVRVLIEGDAMTVDLSGIADETKTTINASRSGGGETVARLAFRYLIIPEEHASEGSFRPLKLELPDGKILSASETAAKGHYNATLPTLVDLVIKALGPVLPERVASGHYGTFSTVRFTGHHPETGALFQCSDSGFGGWGALCDADGPGPFRTMCHGDTRLIPVEVQEASYPVVIERFELITDSGGAGEFRGGLGLSRCYEVQADCTLYTVFERTQCPPWGTQGGGPALTGSVLIQAVDGSTRPSLKEAMPVRAGEKVQVCTGGGGGYGNPQKRSLQRLKDDVRRGYVSRNAALSAYGVRFDDALNVIERRSTSIG